MDDYNEQGGHLMGHIFVSITFLSPCWGLPGSQSWFPSRLSPDSPNSIEGAHKATTTPFTHGPEGFTQGITSEEHWQVVILDVLLFLRWTNGWQADLIEVRTNKNHTFFGGKGICKDGQTMITICYVDPLDDSNFMSLTIEWASEQHDLGW